jgi:ABC-type transporter Mla subunit MlaD
MEIPGMGLARQAVSAALDTTAAVAAVPGRVLDLIGEVEQLVRKVNGTIDAVDAIVERAGGLVERTGNVVADAEKAVDQVRAITASASDVSERAAQVVTTAGRTAHTADELIGIYEPIAKQAQPLAKRFVDELSPQEIEAAIKLIDELPGLTEHLTSDILPILATLDRVGPELHQLLEVTSDVRQAILGIPGFGFMRRRGEKKEEEEGVKGEENG